MISLTITDAGFFNSNYTKSVNDLFITGHSRLPTMLRFLALRLCIVLHLLIWHIHGTCIIIYYCTIACYPISCDFCRFRPACSSSVAEFASKFAVGQCTESFAQ